MMGHPRLETADGSKVHLRSKKGMALLAMLATAPRYERARVWLQQRLWGSKSHTRAQSSLRRELANLRRVLAEAGLDVLVSDHQSIGLIPGSLQCDWGDASAGMENRSTFLEGFDISGEDVFEDWLREMRSDYYTSTAIRLKPEQTAAMQ